MNLSDPYLWVDPADAVFVTACREALAIERRAYRAADAERRALRANPHAALKAVRAALSILDDDLASYRGDTPPRLWDARGFVCLEDLSCDHDRWMDCQATLAALSACRDVLPPDEWEANTYAASQTAVEHFRRAAAGIAS